MRTAGRPKSGQRRAPRTQRPRGGEIPGPRFPPSPPLLPHFPDFSPRSVSPLFQAARAPRPVTSPSPPAFRVAPAGNELAPPPRPSLLPAAPSRPREPGRRRPVPAELDPSGSDPSGPPPPAAAGKTARTPRRGRAGTAGGNCNTVMTSVKQQESWRLSPGYFRLSPGSSRRAPGAVLPDV